MDSIRTSLEKLIIMILCLYNTYTAGVNDNIVYPFLIGIIFSLILDLLKNKKVKISIYIIFTCLCFFNRGLIFYLPLILYNFYLDFTLYALIPLSIILVKLPIIHFIISFIALYLATALDKYIKLFNENKIVRDQLIEDNIYLQKYNEQLNIDKKKDTHIAILTERNRIAREIHDSIGHSITSGILQVEALKVIANEEVVSKKLHILQNTLSDGMDDIRKSIHNLYSESLDLKSEIENLTDQIPNINTELIFSLDDSLGYNLKFDILSIIKEAITNCIKHSNSTHLKISLLDQPKFYSISIKDNGSNCNPKFADLSKGVGLRSMEDIANKYNGILNYAFDEGFKIHLILMKG